MYKERVDVITLQETHTVNDISKKGFIQGYLLLGVIHNKQYCVATYIKEDIDICHITFKDNQDDIHVMVTPMGNVTVINIYTCHLMPNESLHQLKHSNTRPYM